MPIPPPKQEEPEDEAWLATYADAITLLMAFFVMLVSFSKIDIPTFEKVAAGIKNEIGMGKADAQSSTKILKMDMSDIVYQQSAEEAVEIGEDDKGIVLEFASSAFYKPGSAEIRKQAIPLLAKVAEKLAEPRYATYIVEMEGYTDDDPISTAKYPSNWELSTARAAGVVRLFIKLGLDPQRLKVAGFGETRPKVPNRTADGAPIPENMAQNRRVLARIFPASLEQRKNLQDRMETKDFIDPGGERMDLKTAPQ
ncbi:flagellar motor protein MotB [Magnetospira sp. QH-2]|uniref:OmpA/MotB family protein n=1 Tax=Magnetospira sp. (strain QH-2) TaxID=1288970 RepID=UPI0003E816E0|nr:flagellar motor protein MotB [Magnetospira sp. QH-2]CCQ73425.1 putative Chemotaxis protein motB [Magnetospira sp. QH-2]